MNRFEIKNRVYIKNPHKNIVRKAESELRIINPKWLENQRMGRWNGRTSKMLEFYNLDENGNISMPRGLAGEYIRFCRERDFLYEIVDKRLCLEDIDFEFEGSLKPFQKIAMNNILKKDFGTLNAPTGSGKTVMALYAIFMRKQPCLIIVHTRDLARQWMERAAQFLKIEQSEIGLIGAGKKRVGEKITIGLVQSLVKYKAMLKGRVGHVIVDECHRTPSKTFTSVLNYFDSKYLLGLSATPYRRDNLSSLIFWHLGPIRHVINKEALEIKGDIIQAEPVFRSTEFKPFHDPVTQYSKMMTELVSDDDRNRQIAEDIAAEYRRKGGHILVLSDRKKHCENICSILKFRHKIEAYVFTGDLSEKKRKDVLEKLISKKDNIIIATGQLIGEGFDCKTLSTLFLATPVNFSGRLIQYLGRVLRPSPEKTTARVYDYVDINVSILRRSALNRARIYGLKELPFFMEDIF